jgi:hypothetical protein
MQRRQQYVYCKGNHERRAAMRCTRQGDRDSASGTSGVLRTEYVDANARGARLALHWTCAAQLMAAKRQRTVQCTGLHAAVIRILLLANRWDEFVSSLVSGLCSSAFTCRMRFHQSFMDINYVDVALYL